MKTRVNLYLDEFKPKAQPVSLGQSIGVWLLLIVVLATISWLNSSEQQLIEQQFTTVQTNLANEKLVLQDLQQQIAKRRLDPQLQAQVDLLNSEVKLKVELSKRLSGSNFTNDGFSMVMNDLASIDEPQLWLSAIDIRGKALQLTGLTSSAELVPRWIGSFSNHESLGNKSFHSMLIERDSEQSELLHFQLSSDLDSSELNVAPTIEESNQ